MDGRPGPMSQETCLRATRGADTWSASLSPRTSGTRGLWRAWLHGSQFLGVVPGLSSDVVGGKELAFGRGAAAQASLEVRAFFMNAPFTFYARVLVGLLVILTGGPGPVTAQSPQPDSANGDTSRVQWRTSLPPLTVTASRIPVSPLRAPARITVLDSTALKVTGATSVADLLEDRAGLHVRRYGTSGLATPALRGTGASQTVLLLDGQRITDPQIGHLDLSLLPSALLQSVSVMHGPASPLYGSSGIGGGIHLQSVRPRSSLLTRMTTRMGAFGERGGSLLVGGTPADATSVLVAADYQSTDGDFPYVDDSQFPPETVRRRNADRTRRTLYGSVRSRVGNHRLRLSGWLTRAERGLPPANSTAPARERQWDRQLRLWGRDRMPLGNGRLSVEGLTQRTRLRYRNGAQDIDETGRTGLTSLEASLRYPVSSHWTMAGGLSGSYAEAQHPSLDATAHQEHLSAFAEGTARYERFRLYPALRADAYWMPKGRTRATVNPRLGLNAQLFSQWPGLHLKAQVGRAFRMPTFNDRYWQPGGNPDLRPERSWGGDVGLRLKRPPGHVELTAFGHWRRDQIVWEPTGRGYWSPTNVGRVRALGAEVSASWAWSPPFGDALRAGLTYTVTDTRNRADPNAPSYNEPLLYVPRDQMKSHSTFAWGPAALDFNARYTARRPVTSDGTRFLNAYILVDAQLRLEHDFGRVRGELSLRIENVLDTEYHTIGGRPMPPRHARVRLSLNL